MTAAWNRGVPPAAGWFPVMIREDRGYIGWWDGIRWSTFATKSYDAKSAGSCARAYGWAEVHDVKWQHQPADWPSNARTYSREQSSP